MESSTVDRADTPLEAALGVKTVIEAFHRTAREHAGDTAIRTRGDDFAITWGELRERVDRLAAGLHKLGLRKGDTLALMFPNQFEFHLADLAGMTVGATPFSLYVTASPDQIEYVVGDAGAKIAVVDQQFADRFLAVKDRLEKLEHVVVVGDAPEGTLSLQDVEGDPDPDFDAEAAAAAVKPEDLLTLIYTSGTTGPPKGVELTHDNLIKSIEGFTQIIDFPPNGRVISWLPNAHVAERNAHHYIPIVMGLEVTICDDPRKIVEVLPEVNPNWFFAVPRIWEKIKAGLESKLAAAPEEQAQQARQALDAAIKKVRLEQAGEEVPEELAKAVQQADENMFVHLRKALGLNDFEACNVGAAPTPPEVLEFFHAIGVPIAELWGMSETCGYGTTNPPHGRIKIGTVGPPAPGCEVKLAEDGELLVRGPFVMKGYRNQPDKTAEALVDGWLHTGDVAQIDEDGYVKIVDRKKELIINAAGKNMSPANIESELKSAGPLIGQAAVIGDRRPYNVALIVLDADGAPGWAQKNGVEDASLESLARDEKLREAVQAEVDRANEKLSRVEQIKKFHIVEGDWQPGGDELTPTMKLKRKPIQEKYEKEIEALYAR
ncbi:MAG TPA: AMP-dependent synthetase/ligase [Solirubrobacteraceae bacterium]|jgi:long-subunit acyl-CoA synthetase (AMP-forming)|nr:AMP-dependent synthetase/ligase [Solirubrobacteraceae bacterium]